MIEIRKNTQILIQDKDLLTKRCLFFKKDWFSDLEILEIYGQVNRVEYTQRELSKLIETLNWNPAPQRQS